MMSSAKNAVSSQHRTHGGDLASSESTYANSDAISSFYSMQQQQKLRNVHSQQQQQQQQQPSVAGEYASLCIAMSSPVDNHQNNMTNSQARLRPALYRLSDGFDYDLAQPEPMADGSKVGVDDHRHNNNTVPRNNSNTSNSNNRNSLSLNAVDLDSATAMLDQVAGAGPVTYGEYASTAIALEPMMVVESAAGFADPYYTSEEDELDIEVEGSVVAYRSPPVTSSVTASVTGNSKKTNCHNHNQSSRSQNSRSLPVPIESVSATNSGVTDENRPNNFSLPAAPQTLSTFSGSNGGGHASVNIPPSRIRQNSAKNVGHLDMSQYSNLEGKVLIGGKTAATAKSNSFQEPKLLNKGPPPAAAAATVEGSANTSSRNKILTSSSRKGRSGSGTAKDLGDLTTGNSSSTDADQAPSMPSLPITELSERLAREAKVLAGRRSLVLSTNNPVLSSTATATTSASRQATAMPASNQGAAVIMSQSMHAGPVNNSDSSKQPQTLPTMLDVCRYHGQIRWTKIIENGKRMKKTWTIYYCVFVISPPRLFFFKDEKAALKSPPPAPGNLLKPHQELSVPSPWSVCSQADLPAKLQFTRRKNVLFLAAPNSSQSGAGGASSNSANTSNSSPPLSDQSPGFPDVAFGYLIEAPNTEQADIWLRHFLQSGGLSKYSVATAPPSSPPPPPKEPQLSTNLTNDADVTIAAATVASANSASVEGVQSSANKSAALSISTVVSRTTRSTGTSSKGSLMKLLTGFFKRRPTMEQMKKKGYIRDTIFGSSLENICRRERSEVPAFVLACIGEIEARGLDTDGLYRTSGNLAQVQKLRCMVDQGQPIVWDKWEIAVLTGALKMFFRELREPLITAEVYEKLTEYATRPDLRRSLDPAGREAYLRRCLAMLPAAHFSTARYLFGHFVHVLEHSSSNRMELQSLAIVVAPNLMAPHTDVRSVAAHALLQKYIAEDLIQFYFNVFFTASSNDPQQHHYANSTMASNNNA